MTAHKFISLAAILAIVGGLLVLIGWRFEITTLKSIFPFWVSMKANTALCFVLIGIALLSVQPLTFLSVKLSRLLTRFGELSVWLVGIIALLNLSEYLFGWNLGIDQSLFDDDKNAVATSNLGRMAPETAFCFVLLATALYCKDISKAKNQRLFISISCGLLVIILALSAIFCYITPILGTFGWFGYTVMAIHTALLFLLLGFAIIAFYWKTYLSSWSLSSTTTCIFVFSLMLLTFIALNTSRFQFWLKETNQKIFFITEEVNLIETILTGVVDNQTHDRGYIITGDKFFLENYIASKDSINTKLEALKHLNVPAEPVDRHQQNFVQIEKLVASQLAWHQYVIDEKRLGKLTDAHRDNMIKQGSILLNNLSRKIKQIEFEHQQVIKTLERQSIQASYVAHIIIIIGIITSLTTLLIFLFKLNLTENRRKQTEFQLKKRLNELKAFYNLNKIVETEGITLEHLCQELVTDLPKSWQYPEITCAKIVLKGEEFTSPNFKITAWQQVSLIIMEGTIIGRIKVGYLEERPIADESVFLKEERILLNAIAEQLGQIIKRKQAEQMLLERERSYYNLFNAMTEAVYVQDIQGRFLDVNDSAINMCGYPKSFFLGKTLEDFSAPNKNNQATIKTAIEKAFSGEPQQFEFWGQCSNNEVFSNEVHLSKGNYFGQEVVIAVAHDVSERKRLEETHLFLSQCALNSKQENFFNLLARYLSKTLEMNFVCIDILEKDRLTAKTLALYYNGVFEDNVTYALQDTPCGTAVGQTVCCFKEGVCELFPKDQVLKRIRAESYIGVTLWSSDGQAIGLIAVIAEHPLTNTALAESVLKTVSFRVAGELERMLTENELKESQSRYERVINGTNDGIWEWVLATDEYYLSPRWKHLLGYQDHELPNLQSTFYNHLHPEDQARVLEAIHAHFEQRVSYKIDLRLRCKNGQYRWFHTRGQAIWDEQAQPVRMSGSITDITARKLAEETLRKSEQQLQLVLEGGFLGFWDWNIVTNQVERNAIWAKMLGYSYEEIQNSTQQWTDFIYPLDREKAWQSIEDTLAGRRPYHEVEYRMLHKDGSIIWILDHASVVQRDASGKPTRMSGSHTDITKLKQLEAQLRESKNFFKVLAKVSPIGIYQTDASGHCLFLNDKGCEIAGITSQQAKGMIWCDALKIADRDSIYQKWQTTVQQQRIFRHEYRVQQANAQVVWVYGLSTILFDEQGNISGHVGTVTDITELKLAEEAMRAAELQAVRANQAKSEFLANMSHEIRTPMNAILGFSSILSDLISDSTQQYYLDAITKSGKTLLRLINDILDLSKIEAGRFTLQYTPVAIQALLDEIAIIFSQKLNKKSIMLSLSVAENVPSYLMLDEIRLRQILLNLVGNAVKFTEFGFIKITVTAEPCSENTEFNLVIAVSDSGIGVAKDQQEQIFAAFTQQKNQSAIYGGTGLGLTICKRLLELMGGSISLESELGKGSCFTLKLNNVKGIDKQVPQLVEDDNLLANLDFLPAMILLVDDLPFNRQLIRAYLADFKELRIIEAETGDYALSLLRQCHFDLILMDKRLPDEDGESVCRKMKALPKCATIPIIMVTASVLAVTEAEFPPAYNLQLDKPVNKKQLLMAMQSFLRTKLRPQTAVMPAVIEVAPPFNASTPAQVEALSALLKTDYQMQIAALNNPEILQIDELIDIAEQLIDLAEQYHCHLLHNWAETLKKQAELFDLSNLPETLTHFEQLLTQLQDYLQANSS